MKHYINKLFYFVAMAVLMACTSDNGPESEAGLTQNQQDFIALLKLKYPTQVVNFTTETAINEAPYAVNQKTTFTFSSSGMLFIDTNPEKNDGDEIELPVFTISGNEYIWKDTEQDLSYVLSLTAENFINEINVFKTSTNTFYNSLKVSSDAIEVEKTYSYLLLPNEIECTSQTKNKIETDQRLITMRTKFCDGSQKSLSFNFKADIAIATGTYQIQATNAEEKNPLEGNVAVSLFIDGENYYGQSGTITIKTNNTLNTLVDCVFEGLVLKNSNDDEIVISGQILGV
ncbi:hypothetical protein [Ochrovirga pacifica]|uniref:hypothetical protein n=1 Tax=Ochrovirga pacifica TaxID=1042376 RepID=UPI000255A2A4|nr:hypothetical protein [Ochrovirga pacifica]